MKALFRLSRIPFTLLARPFPPVHRCFTDSYLASAATCRSNHQASRLFALRTPEASAAKIPAPCAVSSARTERNGSSMSTIAEGNGIKSVVVIVAMEAEAAPLIERLGLVEDSSKFSSGAPCKCFSGVYQGAEVNVVTNGKCKRFGVDQIGTVAGGLSTWLSVEVLKPDLVINAGTAGGFKKHDTAIGDVFISTRVRNHDRRIPIPGFKEYGVGDHESHPTPEMVKYLEFKTGVVTTGSSFDHTAMDDKIMEENDARVKDMEAAGFAWACEQHGTPAFCVKVVTDLVDGGGVGEEEFLQNLKAASEALQDALPKILDFVLERSLTDL